MMLVQHDEEIVDQVQRSLYTVGLVGAAYGNTKRDVAGATRDGGSRPASVNPLVCRLFPSGTRGDQRSHIRDHMPIAIGEEIRKCQRPRTRVADRHHRPPGQP